VPNPKRKHTRSRRDSRRSANWKLDPISVSRCEHCGKNRRPHRVCNHCGFYAGQLVAPVKERKSKGGEGQGEGGSQK